MSMLSDQSEPLTSARFSDGKSAAAVNVEVRLGATGVEIIVPGSEAVIWPYDSLTAAEIRVSTTGAPGCQSWMVCAASHFRLHWPAIQSASRRRLPPRDST